MREIERSDGGDLVIGSATAFATARESQGREMKKAACDRTFLLASPLAASSSLDKNDHSQPFLLT